MALREPAFAAVPVSCRNFNSPWRLAVPRSCGVASRWTGGGGAPVPFPRPRRRGPCRPADRKRRPGRQGRLALARVLPVLLQKWKGYWRYHIGISVCFYNTTGVVL